MLVTTEQLFVSGVIKEVLAISYSETVTQESLPFFRKVNKILRQYI